MNDQVAVNTFPADRIVYKIPFLNTSFSIEWPPYTQGKLDYEQGYDTSQDSTRYIDPFFRDYYNDSNTQVYNTLIMIIFFFFIIMMMILFIFVFIKRDWCQICTGWMIARPTRMVLNRACSFGRVEDAFMNPPRTPYNKTLEDVPPPYEDPPEYSSLPKEFILDPKHLSSSLMSLKTSSPATQHKEQVKIKIESEIEQPVAPPRKIKVQDQGDSNQSNDSDQSNCSQKKDQTSTEK